MGVVTYDSFADVPLDDPPEYEGDDSIPLEERLEFAPRTLASSFTVPTTVSIVVPYPGLLHEGSKGDAVYGVKRMLHRRDGTLPVLMAAPPKQKRTWGGFFTRKLRKAQKQAGLPVTGVWDKATHNKFARVADAYAIDLLTPPAPSPQEIKRRALLVFLTAFYNRRYAIPYSQARPSQLRAVKDITRADCSGSIACGMWTAGVMPHINWYWTNTDTQISLGSPVPSSSIRVGDVAFYGHGMDPNHETCVISVAPGDIRVFSDGSYPAKILDIDYNRGSLGGRIAVRRLIL